MGEAKRVKVEVVDEHGRPKRKVLSFLSRIKILIAVILDGIDFLVSWIPGVNTLMDFVTFGVLFLLLKNKSLAYFSLGELLIPGIGALGLIDGFIPAATILTLIDTAIGDRI